MTISGELTAKLGKALIRKGGDELVFKCHWCSRKKLGVSVVKKIYHCFRCGQGGRLEELFRVLGIQMVHTPVEPKLRPVVEFSSTPATIPGFVRSPLVAGNYDVAGFLQRRNISQHLALFHEFGISYESKLRNRLIIPIKENGVVVSYVARALDERIKPKELSPPAGPMSKSNFVFNIDCIKEDGNVVIVEGIFDALRLAEQGYPAVAIMGSNLADVQLGRILARRPASITLMFDGDEAGKHGWMKAHAKISARCSLPIQVIILPAGTDPDELSAKTLYDLLTANKTSVVA